MPDKYRLIGDAKRAGGLAGSRAKPAGKFRKIVCRVQKIAGLLPAAFIDKLVEIRYRVMKRAARTMTERYAAVHAPGRLPVDLFRSQRQIQFPKIMNPLFDRL